MDSALAARIDALLPQTQCTRCGYDGCAPYARAVAGGDADIDRCPPGGDAVVAALAALTRPRAQAARPRAAARPGRSSSRSSTRRPASAARCASTPARSTRSSARQAHARDPAVALLRLRACVAPCPVDCIAMVPAATRVDARRCDATRASPRRAATTGWRATSASPTASRSRHRARSRATRTDGRPPSPRRSRGRARGARPELAHGASLVRRGAGTSRASIVMAATDHRLLGAARHALELRQARGVARRAFAPSSRSIPSTRARRSRSRRRSRARRVLRASSPKPTRRSTRSRPSSSRRPYA